MEIKHLVIYLGEKPPKMRTQLKEEEVFTGFDLVNVHDFNPDELLSSQVPEVILLAILGDYPKTKAEAILRLILSRLKSVCQHKADLSRYIEQLIILSRLRRLEFQTIQTTSDMPVTIDVEKDYLYLQGQQKGVKQGMQEGVSLRDQQLAALYFKEDKMPIMQIVKLLRLPIQKVEEILRKSGLL